MMTELCVQSDDSDDRTIVITGLYYVQSDYIMTGLFNDDRTILCAG